ncbi:7726_t:CDS:2, partial [Racocetra fulgida]
YVSDEILSVFGSQVLSVHPNDSSQPMLSDEILPAFDSQVLSVYPIEQSSQPILSDEILPPSNLQVSSICSIQQKCVSSEFNMSNTNNVDNRFINYDIFDINEQQNVKFEDQENEQQNQNIEFEDQENKQQNVEFEDQEKLEIVSGLLFQNWEQLDCISYSKKTAILENQKQSHTKQLGCKWVVNTTCPKTTKKIKITSYNFKYFNHEIHPDTINFASYYWQFPDEVKQEININISLLQEKSEIDFYENLDDFSATNVNEIISSLSTLSIQEIWETTRYQASHKNYYSDKHYSKSDESLISQPSITYKNRSATSTSNFILDLTLMYPDSSIAFDISKTLNNRHAYGVTNGLCKKAMAVGLDASSAAMETLNKFLDNFIRQYSVANTVLSEIQDNELSDLDDQENIALFDISSIKI